MNRFYTKKGDDGYTSTLGSGRAAKYDPRIETVGTLDEANAAIGLARSFSRASQTAVILLKVQNDLYHMMSEIAASRDNAVRFRKIDHDRVRWLEDQTDSISSMVTVPEAFIVPGDSQAGAAIDLARAIVRRAERHIARLVHEKKLDNLEILHFINRLSSLCFVLEILENQTAGENTTLTK